MNHIHISCVYKSYTYILYHIYHINISYTYTYIIYQYSTYLASLATRDPRHGKQGPIY